MSTVFGIPTVKRNVQSYLETTLASLFDNMVEGEKNDSLVIVLVAETNLPDVAIISSLVGEKFSEHIKSGLLEIISPPDEFYPNMTQLKQTLGDGMDRIKWRSKQSLDFAFLMIYAKDRGTYYVQLEDDVITKKGFVSTMKSSALQKTAGNDSWFLIDFCSLGFIGKMFQTVDLPVISQFFLMFYNDKPVDWLLPDLVRTRFCPLHEDSQVCLKRVWLHHHPSLFQHIGTHSSLAGKTQKLKDGSF